MRDTKFWAGFRPKISARAYQGSHQFKDQAGNRHGHFKVEWHQDDINAGWYWCELDHNQLPKETVRGPFETSYRAYHDAVEREP